jgi:hypothetical protein
MLLMSMMTLVACGGGDGDLTGGSDGGTSGAVTLTVTKSDGDLSAVNDVTVTATVVNNGSAVVNKTVTFTLAVEGSATFDPVSSTATTDASGIATITVKVTDIKGSVNVIATYESATDNISFNSAGDGVKVVEGEAIADTIVLFTNSQQIASSGAQTIELTAIAKDSSNNLLEGITINFASDSGSLEDVVDGTNVTGADGKVVKILSTPAQPSNRVITVTITNGDVSDSLEIQVVGTILTLTGSSSLAIDDETNYIIKVLDSDGNGVANTDVAITLTGTSTEEPAGDVATITTTSSVTTDFNGQAQLTVEGTTGGTNSIVATALGATVSQDVSVQSDSFVFTNFSNVSDSLNPSISPILPDVALSKMATVELTWKREGAEVPDGTLVEFTTTRGTLSAASATTISGKVNVTLDSDDAGKALVTFTGSDNVNGKDIKLSNQLKFEFFADTADNIIAQASPSTIAPNGQTSTISVIVRDLSGNLVKNKTIDFKLTDTSSGEIFPASAVTDSNGSASTVYTSSSTSQVNGVTIESTVRDTPLVKDSASLTVSKRSAFITLQTGNSILQVNDTTYNKQYSVQVNDLNGAAIKDLTLTVSAIPKDYFKGQWGVVLKDGKFDHYAPFHSATCFNEDGSNGGDVDGILDVNEDVNSDTFLTPGNVVNVSGEVTTDETGLATIDIIYGENYGGWVDVDLKATAKVNGSENIAHVIFRLSSAAEDVTNEGNPPAAFIWPEGPFGIDSDCTNVN